jgi:hypothetical protein
VPVLFSPVSLAPYKDYYGIVTFYLESIASDIPTLMQSEAVIIAESETGGKYNNWPIQIEVSNYVLHNLYAFAYPKGTQYFSEDSDHVVLVYSIQIQDQEEGEWYRVAVDADSGRIVDVVSFVSDASVRLTSLNLLAGVR